MWVVVGCPALLLGSTLTQWRWVWAGAGAFQEGQVFRVHASAHDTQDPTAGHTTHTSSRAHMPPGWGPVVTGMHTCLLSYELTFRTPLGTEAHGDENSLEGLRSGYTNLYLM